ncbi:Aminotransferase-like, plant mobile domain [Sesbania bispinosa]|nr:Aminotransferase-like, plant mobile domain [Sesbania bispinosa]
MIALSFLCTYPRVCFSLPKGSCMLATHPYHHYISFLHFVGASKLPSFSCMIISKSLLLCILSSSSTFVTARFRPSETSPSSSSVLPNENVVEPMPRSISLAILPKLPSPRAVPANADSRRWLLCVPFAERPFDTSVITSSDSLFSSSVAFSSVGCSDALLRYSISSTPSLELAGIVDAIKASPFLGVHKRSDELTTLVQRWSSKTHTFFTSWGEFSPTLEDVAILLKLPLFGDFDLSSAVLERRFAEMSKVLKAASAEGARHSRKKLALRRASASPSTVKVRLPKGKRSEATSSTRSRVKYTYATWVHFFLGDFPSSDLFEAGPDHPQSLERAAFVSFWLSRYVFLSPPWESVSLAVFTVASLLAEGVRLPLGSFYLGGLYGRLDQLQEQMYFSYGRFSINSCVDVVFLQIFLYERFLCYGPVKRVPKPPCMDRIYLEPSFSTQNDKSSRTKGVYDFWLLCLYPHVLPGFIITDTVGLFGGVLFPFHYRPDRVCRQFGLDLPPLPLDLDSYVLADRIGRVLDEWVVYQRRLKASIAFFESVKSTSPPHELLILLTDPYYVTSPVDYDKSERLRARPIQGSLRCPSSSSGHFSDSDEEGTGEAFGKSQDSPSLSNPPRSDSTQHTSVLHVNLVTSLNDSRASEHMPPGQPHAMIQNFSVEVFKLPAWVMTPFTGSSSLSLGMHTSDARLLKEFSERHAGFLLSESYPSSYQRLAYEQFLDLLKRLRSNSILALLGPLKSEILDKLKMLSCLGFKGAWFDELMRFFQKSVSPSVFEESGKIFEAVKMLQSKIDKEKASLVLHESELSKLLTKQKEIEDAQSGLKAMFTF